MPPQSGLILREGTLFKLFGNICDFSFQIFLLKCKLSVSRLYCHSDIWCRESKYAKAHSANGRLHDDQIRHFANLIRIENKISPLMKGSRKKKYKGMNISTWRKLSIYLFWSSAVVEQEKKCYKKSYKLITLFFLDLGAKFVSNSNDSF